MANFCKVDQPITEPYHYSECGLDGVFLLNGHRPFSTHYGEGVAIEDEDELLHCIAMSVINRRPIIGGKELRFLRKRMDMT